MRIIAVAGALAALPLKTSPPGRGARAAAGNETWKHLTMMPPEMTFEFLRSQIVGADTTFSTPFGERLMVYCDYTASGRSLAFIERYLLNVQRHYANTHTEDDITGRSMTRLLHGAERCIKDAVNAGPDGRILAIGTGSTGAIDRFQQILGVGIAPASRALLFALLGEHLGDEGKAACEAYLDSHQPVVFVGPYEHHSNEVTWRQGLATVIEVGLGADGGIDLADLERLLRKPEYLNRTRIGSFSAASNVTGMCSPVQEIARLLHRHGALACFDYAACAPYVTIDMNPPAGADGGDPSCDAIFISPHKFLGGPGASGALIFNQRVYHRELGPSVAGGGTVDYVGPVDQDFVPRIEERERAGTPGVLQTLKAALAFEVKDAVGVAAIEQREQALLRRAFERWQANPGIEILGNPDPTRRVAIVSFNLRDPRGRFLHPKFVTVLLNDLFGIQSRAGCSCAGPYGHRLLGIDEQKSQQFRAWVKKGYTGIKPGWCRIGFHYTMDDAEADYVIKAVDFTARHGYLFLSLYRFDLETATWSHRDEPETGEEFSLHAALHCDVEGLEPLALAQRQRAYARCLDEARDWARRLAPDAPKTIKTLDGELGELQFFSL